MFKRVAAICALILVFTKAAVAQPQVLTSIKGTPLYAEVESKMLTALTWETSTDRDQDFQRTHPRAYYDHAVRYVVNKVNAAKAKKRRETLESWKLGLKAWVAKRRMGRAK